MTPEEIRQKIEKLERIVPADDPNVENRNGEYVYLNGVRRCFDPDWHEEDEVWWIVESASRK